MIHFDVIMPSYAKTPDMKAITEKALQTLFDSEDPQNIRFRAVVFEQAPEVRYIRIDTKGHMLETIHYKYTFNYNRVLNDGIRRTNAPYVLLCNNDLEFHKGFAGKLLPAFYACDSLSPYCPISHKDRIQAGPHLWK